MNVAAARSRSFLSLQLYTYSLLSFYRLGLVTFLLLLSNTSAIRLVVPISIPAATNISVGWIRTTTDPVAFYLQRAIVGVEPARHDVVMVSADSQDDLTGVIVTTFPSVA